MRGPNRPGGLVWARCSPQASGTFRRGDREEALHLLDVLLSRETPSAAAIELAILRPLESESKFFWLSAWLRNQAEGLGSRLARAD